MIRQHCLLSFTTKQASIDRPSRREARVVIEKKPQQLVPGLSLVKGVLKTPNEGAENL
jgi:hypothetical protein